MGTNRNEKLITGVALALLGVFVLQAFFSMDQQSPTMDEQNHIARGYAYLRTGDLRLSQEHPPLINTISALPLLILNPQLPTGHPSWASANWYAFGDELLWQAVDADGDPIAAQKMVNWARVPIVLLGVLLGMGVYAWAAELYGPAAGLLALGLYAFSPNLLAHTHLATNDLGVACFFFFALYTFWRFTLQPSVVGIVAAGVALGLALAAKFSALILLPILALLVAIRAWRRPTAPASPPPEPELMPLTPADKLAVGAPEGAELYRPKPVKPTTIPWWRTFRWQRVLHLAAILLIGLAVVWGIYGLERSPMSDGGASVPMPSYWNGIKTILERTERGNPAFLMGKYSTDGWWYYFPVAFIIKTSLPTLLLLALALAHTIHRKSWRQEMWLLLPVAVYFIILMGSSLNIGYRHLLPVLPLLFVYVSKLASEHAQVTIRKSPIAKQALRWALGLTAILLIAWQAYSALNIHPHYLAFFNETVGGPANGHKYLVDSNLDWGQDLPALRDYLIQAQIDQVQLSWFGPARPEQYDIDYRPLPGFPLYQGAPETYAFNPYKPAPGIYAISATNLQGVTFEDHDTFAWFRDQEPLARPGYSLFVYRVPEPKGLPHTVVFGGVGFHDLPTEALRSLLSPPNTRVRAFDPATSFLAPATGQSTYAVADLLPFAPALRRALLNDAEILTQTQSYTIYRLDASTPLMVEATALAATNPAWWSDAVDFAAADLETLRRPVALPVDLHRGNDALTLAGYDPPAAEAAPGQTLRLITYWRAQGEPPIDLQIFVHLLDAQSRLRAGWDGLDVPPHGWQPGDLIAQYTQLKVPVDAPPGDYQLEIGLYTATDGQRFVLLEGENAIADRLLLRPVRIIE